MRRFMIHNLRLLSLALTTLVLLILLVPRAHAGTVSLDPLYHAFNDFLQLVIEGLAMALSGWLMFVFHKYLTPWFGAQMETKARDSLNTALANGVAIALNKVEDTEQLHSRLEVKGAVAAWAAQYAIDHAPGAVDRFGLSPEQLALKALAYVPPAPTAVDTTGALAPPHPAVEQRELPPVTSSSR